MDCATAKLEDFPIKLLRYGSYFKDRREKLCLCYSFSFRFNVDFLLNIEEGDLCIWKNTS